MTNLLPPEEQHRIEIMYLGRFIFIGGLALIITAFIAAILLAPNFIILAQSQAALEHKVIAPVSASSSIEKSDLLRAKTLLDVLSTTTVITRAPSKTIARVLSYKPAGVTINHIMYTNGSILLQGTAGHAAVDAYHRALSADPIFKTITVPVGSLVGNDQDFSITISGNI
ncbi:MAG: hypothetical protein JWO50_357 [Candidatus Kaiserbacteria bacterium]|nr:hypothetical protein [Candidatus Kaiserbacteria bacterium]